MDDERAENVRVGGSGAVLSQFPPTLRLTWFSCRPRAHSHSALRDPIPTHSDWARRRTPRGAPESVRNARDARRVVAPPGVRCRYPRCAPRPVPRSRSGAGRKQQAGQHVRSRQACAAEAADNGHVAANADCIRRIPRPCTMQERIQEEQGVGRVLLVALSLSTGADRASLSDRQTRRVHERVAGTNHESLGYRAQRVNPACPTRP